MKRSRMTTTFWQASRLVAEPGGRSAVFMGTPEIAVPCLEAVVAWAARVRVVTQPDRPAGRSGQPRPSPVKARAEALGLEVAQPERLRGNEPFQRWLQAEPVDVIVVVAFGQILPPAVLSAPRLGCVNVHYSLLPKYRGAAPVQWALINGETVTGVTTMLMDEGLDTGDLLLADEVAIEPDETAGALLTRLAALAPGTLRRTLEGLAAGTLTPQPQDEARAVLAPRLSKSDGQLDWSQPAQALVNRVRGVTPWPGAVAELAGETIKVLAASVVQPPSATAAPGTAPGTVLAVDDERGVQVAAGHGAVWLHEVQEPGRRALPASVYARGKRLSVQESA